MAAASAIVAFAIDAMLPGLGDIAADLTPEAPNRAQLIVSALALGLGTGTLIVGPLSDAFGRRPIIIGGVLLYIVMALVAYRAPTLELLLAARFLMGVGGAAPRIVSIAIIRDGQTGRDMARTMSFVMMIFGVVPAMAPLAGASIMEAFGWRSIFAVFALFGIATMTWFALRQPETLPKSERTAFRLANLWHATREMFAHPTCRLAILVQVLCYAMLFSFLTSAQPVYDLTFGQGAHFHYWFGATAAIAATSSYVNSRLVGRLGMRKIVKAALGLSVVFGILALGIWISPLPDLAKLLSFFVYSTSVFMMMGLTLGNLNALALEPMGHIAGLASSVTMACATIGSLVMAVPVGQAFDGTPVPLIVGTVIFAALGAVLTARIRRDSDPV